MCWITHDKYQEFQQGPTLRDWQSNDHPPPQLTSHYFKNGVPISEREFRSCRPQDYQRARLDGRITVKEKRWALEMRTEMECYEQRIPYRTWVKFEETILVRKKIFQLPTTCRECGDKFVQIALIVLALGLGFTAANSLR